MKKYNLQRILMDMGVVYLINGWLSNAEKELKEVKKKHNWEE